MGEAMDLVGAAEVAERLGWVRGDGRPDSGRVSTYLRKGLLPPPLADLRAGPVWNWEDIARVAVQRGWLPLWRYWGFSDEKDFWDATERVAMEGDATLYLTRIPDGRWAAWGDAEIALDRVVYYTSREDALRDQEAGWQAVGDDQGERVRWTTKRPRFGGRRRKGGEEPRGDTQ